MSEERGGGFYRRESWGRLVLADVVGVRVGIRVDPEKGGESERRRRSAVLAF